MMSSVRFPHILLMRLMSMSQEFPTISHDNLEEPSSPSNQALDACVVNEWDPIDQLHPTNDEAPSLYNFPDGTSFEIGQNFVSKEELKTSYMKQR